MNKHNQICIIATDSPKICANCHDQNFEISLQKNQFSVIVFLNNR